MHISLIYERIFINEVSMDSWQ